jgi:D-alanyl-D-alanine carboxypeptidase (penicillin-binding protein 5/6)
MPIRPEPSRAGAAPSARLSSRARRAPRAAVAALALAAMGAAGAQALPPPPINARSWLLVDVTSGQVLASQQPDQKVEPASLTKLMTAYLAFGALKEGRLKADQRPPVSRVAWKAEGSRMFVAPDKPATVDELLNGMIVQSGNDASVILAEAVAGSEQTFANAMNQAAKRLGMANTNFVNATGLPDAQHYSTAGDLARLAIRIIEDYPQFYSLYSRREYSYNGITQANRNRLLFSDPSVDGMKTGHTEAAGYCLVSSAKREQAPAALPGASPALAAPFQRRLLSVVLGAPSDSLRLSESQKLLNYGFQNFDAVRLYAQGAPAGTYEVWKGAKKELPAGFERDVVITVPKGQAAQLKPEIERVQPLVAPIAKGQRIGTLRVKLGDTVVAERPLLAMEEIGQGGWFSRSWDSIRLMLK